MANQKFWKNKKIVVTGGGGFLGSHVVKKLKQKGATRIKIPQKKTHDLRNKETCIKTTKGAQIVFHLAGNVGGIGYNQQYPGTLFYDNIIMGMNIIEACKENFVGKLVIVGNVCSYTKHTPVPFKESDLWNGYPEETNAPYGIAKKALLVQAQAYKQEFGFKGKLVWDKTKPNGQPRRMLDTSRARLLLNFQATTDFEKGLKNTIKWFQKNR